MKKKKFEWKDIKQILEFKTFYFALIFVLVGIIFLLLSYIGSEIFGQALKEIFLSLGITFLTSATISIISEVFMKMDLIDFMSQKMKSAIPEEFKNNIGVKEFQLDRKNIDFKEFWKTISGNVKIIGVSSNDILASANFPLIRQRLHEDKELTIQILLLSPWSFTARTRASAKGYQTKYEGITKTHAVIHDILEFNESRQDNEKGKNRLQLRLYDDIPSLSMVIRKECAIVAPFMVIEIGGSSPYYIVMKNEFQNNSLYDGYVEHFDTIWTSATPIDTNTDLNRVYQEQHNKDMSIINEFPEKYDNWLLSINHVEGKN